MEIGFTHKELEIITPEQLGNILKISQSTVYRLVNKRAIPFYKIRGSLRFKFEDVINYLGQCRVKPANEMKI